MDYLVQSFLTSGELIFGGDPMVWSSVRTSLGTSFCAILLAGLVGVPAGYWLGTTSFPGRRFVVTLLNTLMAMPTVVVGLLLFGLLSRQGPLGGLGWLFTPMAMIAGQALLALPIVTNLMLTAVSGADHRILPTLQTLGVTGLHRAVRFLLEIRFGAMAAIIAGFGRVVGEVGVAMMLGGNINGYTRTMTTAIALETSKGEFALGLALGILLMLVALTVNVGFNLLQQKES